MRFPLARAAVVALGCLTVLFGTARATAQWLPVFPGGGGQAGGVSVDETSYLDLDEYLDGDPSCAVVSGQPPWVPQLLPASLIYRPYLAGPKEPRLGGRVFNDFDGNWFWDGNLGGQVGLVRWGTTDSFLPEGVQLDAEGAAQVRLNISDDVDLYAADFRGGLPLTFGWGRHRTKLAYYHLSSHLGDEFVLKHPGFNRLNYSRDALLLGHAILVGEATRIYTEVGWAFHHEVAGPWEFQVGAEHAPRYPTGPAGAPFAALNVHLREEVDFRGGMTVQLGWAWVGDYSPRRLRVGLFYFHGKSSQFSFPFQHDQHLGAGVWYDL